MTTHHEVIEFGTCPSDVLVQKAGLIALTPALELSKENKLTFGLIQDVLVWNGTYTWSHLERKRPFDISRQAVKKWETVLGFFESIQKPEEVAIVLCRAREAAKTKPEVGNHLANKSAKEAAEKGTLENKVYL